MSYMWAGIVLFVTSWTSEQGPNRVRKGGKKEEHMLVERPVRLPELCLAPSLRWALV